MTSFKPHNNHMRGYNFYAHFIGEEMRGREMFNDLSMVIPLRNGETVIRTPSRSASKPLLLMPMFPVLPMIRWLHCFNWLIWFSCWWYHLAHCLLHTKQLPNISWKHEERITKKDTITRLRMFLAALPAVVKKKFRQCKQIIKEWLCNLPSVSLMGYYVAIQAL